MTLSRKIFWDTEKSVFYINFEFEMQTENGTYMTWIMRWIQKELCTQMLQISLRPCITLQDYISRTFFPPRLPLSQKMKFNKKCNVIKNEVKRLSAMNKKTLSSLFNLFLLSFIKMFSNLNKLSLNGKRSQK